MTTVAPRTIKLEGDLACTNDLLDTVTGEMPWAWARNDLQISACLFEVLGETLYDVSNVDQILITVRAARSESSPALIRKVVEAADFGSPDLEDWYTDADQHALFTLAAADVNLDLAGQPSRMFYIWITAILSTGEQLTFGSSGFQLREPGEDASVPASPARSPEIYFENGKMYAWDFGTEEYVHMILRNGTWEKPDE